MKLYLDLETIPSQSLAVHAEIAKTVTVPGNISKPETIAKWEAETKPGMVKEAIARTSFDGAAGHICCIGWAVGEGKVRSASVLRIEDERSVLQAALAEMDKVSESWEPVRVIGHNVVNFDIRFIWQRAIVLGIRMPAWFPRDPKPWSNEVFDTQTAFAGSRGTIGMDRLCLALGMDGKGDVDGSMVAQMWTDGRHEDIATYCRADIERTRAIHRRMMVVFGEEMA